MRAPHFHFIDHGTVLTHFVLTHCVSVVLPLHHLPRLHHSCVLLSEPSPAPGQEWWELLYDLPSDLFRVDFVVVDKASGVVDNNGARVRWRGRGRGREGCNQSPLHPAALFSRSCMFVGHLCPQYHTTHHKHTLVPHILLALAALHSQHSPLAPASKTVQCNTFSYINRHTCPLPQLHHSLHHTCHVICARA